MARLAYAELRSPVRVELDELLRLRVHGEALKLGTSRIRSLGSGGHLSAFKGRGVEFDESRPYQPGDDLRSIDWRVTARTGKTHTKVFREERNRPVIVWLDLSATMMFATRGAYKAVRAAETAALVAWSAVAHGDRLGGLVTNELRHEDLRPTLGRRAALRWLELVCRAAFWRPPERTAPAFDGERTLGLLTRVVRPGSLVFLLSDFRRTGAGLARRVRELASHSDVLLVQFYDRLEAELPPPGRYQIAAEEGGTLAIDTGADDARERYRERFAARAAELDELARIRGVRGLSCATDELPWKVLTQQFARS